ncbi:methyltransferase [Cenarchaeum symbiosum A]|uniref:Methyltransferase n=1 Tax=Cenarchaeum symbiosum (strain A) TaxID=414004 RepID=A0RY91_CENSY|nr:methyltransferase [Cenarchaeum symbiosum A]
MLRRALDGVLTEEEAAGLYSAFDQIGGILVIRIPATLLPKRRIIGETLLGMIKPARSVYLQSSDVGGEHRTRRLELLAGEEGTITEYRESGCRFDVDVERAFFSPRLSTERARIAALVRDGETIVNMFAGIGTFSITAARLKKCLVYSIDTNAEATRLCEQNAAKNKLAGTVVPITGDAREVIRGKLRGIADRVLMVLPEDSIGFLPDAADAAKSGCIIHFYSHVHSDERSGARALAEEQYMAAAPAPSEVLDSRIVRAVGPRYYQTVVDARITK